MTRCSLTGIVSLRVHAPIDYLAARTCNPVCWHPSTAAPDTERCDQTVTQIDLRLGSISCPMRKGKATTRMNEGSTLLLFNASRQKNPLCAAR